MRRRKKADREMDFFFITDHLRPVTTCTVVGTAALGCAERVSTYYSNSKNNYCPPSGRELEGVCASEPLIFITELFLSFSKLIFERVHVN